jgi:hypothetical protein
VAGQRCNRPWFDACRVVRHMRRVIRDKRQNYKHYIARYGDDLAEISNWPWGGTAEVTGTDNPADNI